eukprot:gnl/Chilomastix_cuspidata/976.p1 GENE.gnl/Chilomastix_cuspidata/976~~gnl/Chilomastix_cuspidata/976.p1  ORF type:complete len:307 (+),score=126.69 gnl/Chilomastix_cuspidata/976:70-990(+)
MFNYAGFSGSPNVKSKLPRRPAPMYSASDSFDFTFGEPEKPAQPAQPAPVAPPPPQPAPAPPAQPPAPPAGQPAPAATAQPAQPAQPSLIENPPTAKEAYLAGKNCCGKMWSLTFYQRFFDITVQDFGKRLLRVLLFWQDDFVQACDGRPDLWGWFWITLTVLFLFAGIFALGNILRGESPEFDADGIGTCAGIFYVYILVVPGIAFLIFKLFGPKGAVRGLDLYCIYGYSIGAYLPIGIAAVVGIDWVVGLVFGICCLFSTGFLIFSIHGFFKRIFEKKLYWIFISVFGLIHVAMGLCLYFIVLR